MPPALVVALSHALFGPGSGRPVVPTAIDALEPIILRPSEAPTRRLRGDFEVPDLLLLTYSQEWESVLDVVAARAPPETGLLLLLEQGDDPNEIRDELESKGLDVRVQIFPAELDSPWVRDYGPLQVTDRNGGLIWLDAFYDGGRNGDDALPRQLSQVFDVPLEPVPERLDGGALISNGAGLCAATLEIFDRAEIDHSDRTWTDALLKQLGCRALVLVPALLDDATKHIDMYAQFTSPNVVMVASFDPRTSEDDAERMDAAAEGLRRAGRARCRTAA